MSTTFSEDTTTLVLEESTFECRSIIYPDEDGDGFCAYVSDLPGVVSQGDTLEKAKEGIKDAFRETILSYLQESKKIPWNREANLNCRPANAKDFWFVVHAKL